MKFLEEPWVTDVLAKRLPAITNRLTKIADFAKLLGPAGVALGVGVDILSMTGLIQDATMEKLDKLSRQIDALREDVQKGFGDIKEKLDSNIALSRFLLISDKLEAQVKVFEQNAKVGSFALCKQLDGTIRYHP